MSNRKGQVAAKKQTELTQEQLAEIKVAFDLFDVDGSGEIDETELENAMRAMGLHPTEEELTAVMRASDDDMGDLREGCGTIEFDEFENMVKKKILNTEPVDYAIRAFKMFDDDKSGKVTFGNLKKVLKQVGEEKTDEEIQEILDICGRGTGDISQEDFNLIMRKHRVMPGV
mmetsp:Transcript_121604/g.344592  ORF Transcript_121604/g.344592 Transcript_121604/m.344592 type:complete len:172 (+) Transcript_121604:78-593(+)